MARHRTQPTATPSAGPLSRRLEDYLEAIGDLVASKGAARVRDIAARTGVSMSTVTAALKQLAKTDLVQYDPYELVRLTAEGEAQAGRIRGTHDVLAGFLTGVLGIDAEGADRTACRMEHVVDEQVLGRMELLAEFLESGDGAPNRNGRGAFAEFCRRRELAGVGEKGTGSSRRDVPVPFSPGAPGSKGDRHLFPHNKKRSQSPLPVPRDGTRSKRK